MNDRNLKSFCERTESEQREIARMGGISSGEARRKKADIKKALIALLEDENYTDDDGNVISGAEKISLELFKKALKGDSRAFEIVRDTSGQAVVQKVMMSEVSQDVIDEVERMVLENE